MSARVTARPSITMPPASNRLPATIWVRSSAMAGPDHATQPSCCRNRRWRSRGRRASRSWSWRMKSMRWRTAFTGSRRRNPVRLAHAGRAVRGRVSDAKPISRSTAASGMP